MKPCLTLNRQFHTDSDGWIHLVPIGESKGLIHAGTDQEQEIIQVMDDASLDSIMTSFNRAATDTNFTGLLIDQEHFSHDTGRSSEAAGWIKSLQRRADGIWGQAEWTDLGLQLIQNKRYKHLSPVLMMEPISGNRMRAVALSDVGLTNKPRLKTLVPVTNRDLNTEGTPMLELLREILGMKEAGEDELIARVREIAAKAQEAEAANTEAAEVKKERDTLKEEAVNREADAFVAKHKDRVKDPAKLKELFAKNREAAEAFIAILQPAAAKPLILNRENGRPPQQALTVEDVEKAEARNREQLDYVEQVKSLNRLPTMAAAWTMARLRKPELFA